MTISLSRTSQTQIHPCGSQETVGKAEGQVHTSLKTLAFPHACDFDVNFLFWSWGHFFFLIDKKKARRGLLIFDICILNWELCPCEFLSEKSRFLPLVGVAWTKWCLEVPGSVFPKYVLEVTQPFRVTPFNSWGLSFFLSCGSATKI